MTPSTPLSLSSVPAQYATPRNLELPTYGPQVGKFMRLLGRDPMPHQQDIADVTGEVRPDGSFNFHTVIVTLPRQAGKTTLLEGVNGHRCVTMRDYRVWYTAQTGLAAVDVWNEWAATFETAMGDRWKMRRSAGQNTATWKATGSFIRVFPPTPESLHSKVTDKVDLDEVFKLSMDQGQLLLQGAVPTQATRKRRQLWIVSTAGTEDSAWFRGWVERGRAAVTDPTSRIAYFEYATPDDVTIGDPMDVAPFHPAYGHTQDADAFRIAFDQLGPVEYARAYGNQWPSAETSWKATWPRLSTPDPMPAGLRVWFGVDATPNLSGAAITAAVKDADDVVHLEVIEHRPGVDWLTTRLRDLSKGHRAAVSIARGGPIGYLVPDLQQAGVRIDALSGEEFVAAGTRFRSLVAAGLIRHRDDPRLNDAVASAIARDTGDRSAWRRRDTTTDISPLVAVSMAAAAAARPRATPKTGSG
jgi:hypothetical protein